MLETLPLNKLINLPVKCPTRSQHTAVRMATNIKVCKETSQLEFLLTATSEVKEHSHLEQVVARPTES